MPVFCPSNQTPGRKQALAELSRHLTPYRFREHERRVASQVDYADVHRSIAARQYEYLESPRGNYVQAAGAWFRDLAPCQAHLLGAANMEARIAFMEIALRRLEEHPELFAEPLFFVTISPRRFLCPLETASKTDLHGLQQTTRQALAGCSFIGSVDFGLLRSWGTDGIPELNGMVSPHTHNIVFGATRAQIDAAVFAMGQDFRDVTGSVAADVMEITARQLCGYFRYALKAPLFQYRVRTGRRRMRNDETDEWMLRPRFGSHPLRSGDQLRMAAVVHEMFLDELLFGQGTGTALVREIRAEAREPIVQRNGIIHRRGGDATSLISPVCALTAADRAPLSKLIVPPPTRLRLGRHSVGLPTLAPETAPAHGSTVTKTSMT